MNKLLLATAISSSMMVSVASASNYYALATSGTLADPLAGFSVDAVAIGTTVSYVDPSSGSVSNKATPAIQLVKVSQWSFDFSNPAAVAFTGNIQLGDYRTQTIVDNAAVKIDGRQNYVGVTQSFSGVGAYDESTNTFTFSFMNSLIGHGGASVYSSAGPVTCVNGATSVLGKVCTTFSSMSPAWEGLTLNFVFNESRSEFFGSIQGTDTSGTGLSRNTTTINWMISSPEVPVPASAWLFGSSLLGLAATRRRSQG